MTEDTSPEIDKLIADLESDNKEVCQASAEALGNIGDARAVEVLIRALGRLERSWKLASKYEMLIDVLVEIGDMEALCEAVSNYNSHLELSATHHYMEVLADTGDPRALDVIIQSITSSKDSTYFHQMECITLWCCSAEEDSPEYDSALDYLMHHIGWEGNIFVFPDGDKAIDALIDELRAGQRDGLDPHVAEILDEQGWEPETEEQRAIYLLAKNDTEAIIEWGEAAIEPLIEALTNGNPFARDALAEMTNNLVKTDKEKKNIIKFLESDDQGMVQMGAAMLKGILEK